MVLSACLPFLLRLYPFVDLRGEFLLEVGAQEAVEEEPSRAVKLVRGEGVSNGGASPHPLTGVPGLENMCSAGMTYAI